MSEYRRGDKLQIELDGHRGGGHGAKAEEEEDRTGDAPAMTEPTTYHRLRLLSVRLLALNPRKAHGRRRSPR